MHSRRHHTKGVEVYPHMAWYVIVAALLVVPVLVIHSVVAWRAMFGQDVVSPVQAASASQYEIVPTDSGPVMVRER